MILTYNCGFAEWGEVFGDPVVATALLKRLLYHAVVVQIEGAPNSVRYRSTCFTNLIQIDDKHCQTLVRRARIRLSCDAKRAITTFGYETGVKHGGLSALRFASSFGITACG